MRVIQSLCVSHCVDCQVRNINEFGLLSKIRRSSRKGWGPVLGKYFHWRLHTHTEHLLWSRRKPGRGGKMKTDLGCMWRPSQALIKVRTGLTWFTVNPWIFSPTWYCSALSQALVLFHLHALGWALLQLHKAIEVSISYRKIGLTELGHIMKIVIWLRWCREKVTLNLPNTFQKTNFWQSSFNV